MSVLENNANRSSSSVISHPQVQDHESEQEDSDEDEGLSVAPGQVQYYHQKARNLEKSDQENLNKGIPEARGA
jgi:hypothetical protein